MIDIFRIRQHNLRLMHYSEEAIFLAAGSHKIDGKFGCGFRGVLS